MDYDRLRHDLIDLFGTEMTVFSGPIGFSEMVEAEEASDDELIEIAERAGLNINDYI